MRNLLTISIMVAMSSVSFAQTLLTCKSSGAGGSLVKSIDLVRTASGLKTQIESDMNPPGSGNMEVAIKAFTSTPVSDKYELDANVGGKTSLVVYKKQAVIIYEGGADLGTNVEFLKCK